MYSQHKTTGANKILIVYVGFEFTANKWRVDAIDFILEMVRYIFEGFFWFAMEGNFIII